MEGEGRRKDERGERKDERGERRDERGERRDERGERKVTILLAPNATFHLQPCTTPSSETSIVYDWRSHAPT